MPERRRMKVGATPGKLALIAVLLVVFIGVIVMQIPDEEPAAEAVTPNRVEAARAPARPDSRARQSAELPAPEPQPLEAWPKVALDEAVRHDPFAWLGHLLPANAGDAQENEVAAESGEEENSRERRRSQSIARIRQSGVGMVLLSDDKKLATIGTHTVGVGDVVDGVRIVEIRDDGVVVAEYVGGSP